MLKQNFVFVLICTIDMLYFCVFQAAAMEPMQVDVVEENHNVEEEQNYNVENPTIVRNTFIDYNFLPTCRVSVNKCILFFASLF